MTDQPRLCLAACGPFYGGPSGYCSACLKRRAQAAGSSFGGAAPAAAATAPAGSGGSFSGAAAAPAAAAPSPQPLPRVVLLGDSTLDNCLWVPAPERCAADGALRAHSVAGCLGALLGAGVPLHNLAADGFTSKDVLEGGEAVLSRAVRRAQGDPIPATPSHDAAAAARSASFFAPLEALQALPGGARDAVVVLSVGGNDVRHCLSHPATIPEAVRALQAEHYPRLLQRLLALTPRVILVMQYRPSFMDDAYDVYAAIGAMPFPGLPAAAPPLAKLEALLAQVYAPILALAAQHQLAVIDLPRSMDPRDASLFSHQIEPSAAGGRLIAGLIHHAACYHSPSRGSQLYFLPCPGSSRAPVVHAQPNDFSPARPWAVGDQGGAPDEPAGSGSGSGSGICPGAAAPLTPEAAIGREMFAGLVEFPGPDVIVMDRTDCSVVVAAGGGGGGGVDAAAAPAGAAAAAAAPAAAPGALLLGNICAARDPQLHAAHGIRLIVQCAEEYSAGRDGAPTPAPGIELLDLRLNDSTAQRLALALEAALPAMARVRRSGGGVLVSCAAGVSRSTSVVLAHLVAEEGLALRRAWGLVRAARPKACANLGFLVQLMAREVAARGEGSIPPQALREAPLYSIVFESDEEGQAFIRAALQG